MNIASNKEVTAASVPQPQRFGTRLLIGVVALNLLVAALGTSSLLNIYRLEIRQVETRARNAAEGADGKISYAFDKVDVALRGVVDELERNLREGGIRVDKANAFIARQQGYVPEIDAIRVANPKGEVYLGPGAVADSGISYADRDFFVTHRQKADAGLIVTQPILGRISHKWVISFNRRLNAPDGSFAGVVSASITVTGCGGCCPASTWVPGV